MEELIDVLDDKGNKTGLIKFKSLIKQDGDYHRAVAICFVNSFGEVLMQRRNSNKKVYPNLWSMFLKGHVRSGEDILSAGIRETSEELGLTINKNDLVYLYTIKETKNTDGYIENLFFDTYLVIKNIDRKEIKMNEEVSDVKWLNYQTFFEKIQDTNSDLVPNYNDYAKILPILDKIFKLGNTKIYQKKIVIKK